MNKQEQYEFEQTVDLEQFRTIAWPPFKSYGTSELDLYIGKSRLRHDLIVFRIDGILEAKQESGSLDGLQIPIESRLIREILVKKAQQFNDNTLDNPIDSEPTLIKETRDDSVHSYIWLRLFDGDISLCTNNIPAESFEEDFRVIASFQGSEAKRLLSKLSALSAKRPDADCLCGSGEKANSCCMIQAPEEIAPIDLAGVMFALRGVGLPIPVFSSDLNSIVYKYPAKARGISFMKYCASHYPFLDKLSPYISPEYPSVEDHKTNIAAEILNADSSSTNPNFIPDIEIKNARTQYLLERNLQERWKDFSDLTAALSIDSYLCSMHLVSLIFQASFYAIQSRQSYYRLNALRIAARLFPENIVYLNEYFDFLHAHDEDYEIIDSINEGLFKISNLGKLTDQSRSITEYLSRIAFTQKISGWTISKGLEATALEATASGVKPQMPQSLTDMMIKASLSMNQVLEIVREEAELQGINLYSKNNGGLATLFRHIDGINIVTSPQESISEDEQHVIEYIQAAFEDNSTEVHLCDSYVSQISWLLNLKRPELTLDSYINLCDSCKANSFGPHTMTSENAFLTYAFYQSSDYESAYEFAIITEQEGLPLTLEFEQLLQEILLHLNRVDDFAEWTERLHRDYPDDINSYLYSGSLCMQIGLHGAGFHYLEEFLTRKSSSFIEKPSKELPDAHYLLAFIALLLKQYDESVKYFLEAKEAYEELLENGISDTGVLRHSSAVNIAAALSAFEEVPTDELVGKVLAILRETRDMETEEALERCPEEIKAILEKFRSIVLDTNPLRTLYINEKIWSQVEEASRTEYQKIYRQELLELISKKTTQYDSFVEFAKSRQDSPSYANELLEELILREGFSFLGVEMSKFLYLKFNSKQESSLLGTGPSTKQSLFTYQMVKNKDFSIYIQSLQEIIPEFDSLPWRVKISLAEAESLSKADRESIDYTPIILEWSKATEILLREEIFSPFKNHTQLKIDTFEEHADDYGNQRLVRFVSKGHYLELGVMAKILESTTESVGLVDKLQSFIKDSIKRPAILSKPSINAVLEVMKLRNSAVHEKIMSRNDADRVRESTIHLINVLYPSR